MKLVSDLRWQILRSIVLDSFYYDSTQLYVKPGKEEETLKTLKGWIMVHSTDRCELEIELNGFLKMSEPEFRKAVEKISGNVKILHAYRNIERVLIDRSTKVEMHCLVILRKPRVLQHLMARGFFLLKLVVLPQHLWTMAMKATIGERSTKIRTRMDIVERSGRIVANACYS